MKRSVLKEQTFVDKTSLDLLALGSWVFYVIVLARAFIDVYRPFIDYLIIAAAILVISSAIVKDYDGYTARVIVLVVFTSNFYNSLFFTIFSSVIAALMIVASYNLKTSKKSILQAALVAGIAIGVAFLAVNVYL